METFSQSFDVLLPHDITIIADNEQRTYASSILPEQKVPRASETWRKIGELAIDDGMQEHVIDFREITFGEATGLPAYNPDRPVVVSRMTIAGALRAGRPIDDLLYPYEPIRDTRTNEFRGVKGLAYAVPVERQKVASIDAMRWPKGVIQLSLAELQSTCPYDTKIFSPDTLEKIPKDSVPRLQVPKATVDKAAEIAYDAQLDESRTARFGVPIYKTQVVGLLNDWSEDMAPGWRVCHIDTPVVASSPSPQHVIMHDLVRDEGGYMLGGRQLARIAPHHFTEPLI